MDDFWTPQSWKSQIPEKGYLKRCKSAYSILFTQPRPRVPALDYRLQRESSNSTRELYGTKPKWVAGRLSGSRCRLLQPMKNETVCGATADRLGTIVAAVWRI